MNQIDVNHYYESLTDAQQACFRWCAVQLFQDDLREMLSQELYEDNYERLQPMLQQKIETLLKDLGNNGHCDSSALDGIFQLLEQHGQIHSLTDVMAELVQKPHDSTELSHRLRAAFPDEADQIALEVQRRRTLDRSETKRTIR